MTTRKRKGMGEYAGGDRAYIMFTMPHATKEAIREDVELNGSTFQDHLASLVNNERQGRHLEPLSFKSIRAKRV